MRRLRKFLLYIWSLSPLFSLTYDKNYVTNENGETKNLRFSFLSIMLGVLTYHFFTITKICDKLNFKFVHKITMEGCQNAGVPPEDLDLKKKSDDFVEHLAAISESDKDIEKEFINYLLNNEVHRIDTAFNKMNFYTGIILVFIPLLFSGLSALNIKSSILDSSPIAYFLLTILFYSLLNWLMYTIQYMQVSGREKSAFKKIKKPDNNWTRCNQLLRNYYFDWQTMRNEAIYRVSFVANTERWVRWSIGIFIMVIVSVIAGNALSELSVAELKSEPPLLVYTMQMDQLKEPFSQDSLTLSEIHVAVKKCIPQKIVAVTNGNSLTMDFIKSEFDQYEETVQVVFYNDTTLATNELKIIVDGGIKHE